jgi:DMSO/TMAO reductase YedYZ molybdopterin-dependent catalytic subunit
VKKVRSFSLIVLTLVLALLTAGCSQPAETPEGGEDGGETAGMGEWSIVIEVIGEEPIEFTQEDAKGIGPAEITAQQKDGDNVGEEQVWTGILLEDLLEFVGVTEYSVISVISADGFTRELDPARVSEGKTGIGWMVDGELLTEEDGPIQFIADQRGPKWWVKQVAKIEVIK